LYKITRKCIVFEAEIGAAYIVPHFLGDIMDLECTICGNIITYPDNVVVNEDEDFVCDDCIEDEEDEEYEDEDDEY